jgi:outer membrane protein TolC
MKTLIWLSFLISGQVVAQTMTFEKIWNDFFEKSPDLLAIRKAKEANHLASERGNLHWLPRISLMGQWSDTNDPGQVFFNNLGQRAITQQDFIPSALNRPERQRFLNASLGLSLPLYEGGMKREEAAMLKEIARSSEVELTAKKTEHFSELSRQYGSLLIHETNLSSLASLKSELSKIISSYQMGSKSNPVGYSGLLGLKGVSNRLEGLQVAFNLMVKNKKDWISEKAGLTAPWKPSTEESINQFISNVFEDSTGETLSTMFKTQELKVGALSHVSKMEEARFLPQLGIFAQNNLYSGDRDSESSQTFGVYLMWDLFNRDSYNRSSEARAKYLSAKAKLESGRQEESVMKANLLSSKDALEANLRLLADSNRLLNEQSVNAMKIFKAGLLSALQLAEVINRRIDVIEQKNNVELQYLDVRSRLYQLSH